LVQSQKPELSAIISIALIVPTKAKLSAAFTMHGESDVGIHRGQFKSGIHMEKNLRALVSQNKPKRQGRKLLEELDENEWPVSTASWADLLLHLLHRCWMACMGTALGSTRSSWALRQTCGSVSVRKKYRFVGS
jgi:hypothetical protein